MTEILSLTLSKRSKLIFSDKRETGMKRAVFAAMLLIGLAFFASGASGSGVVGTDVPGWLHDAPGAPEIGASGDNGTEDEEDSPEEAPDESPDDSPDGPDDVPDLPSTDPKDNIYVYAISLIRIRAYVEGVGEKKDKVYVDPSLKDIQKQLTASFKGYKQFHAIDKIRPKKEGSEAGESYKFDPLVNSYYIVISPISGADKIKAAYKIFRHWNEKDKEKKDVFIREKSFVIKSAKGVYLAAFTGGDGSEAGPYFIFGIKIESVKVEPPK